MEKEIEERAADLLTNSSVKFYVEKRSFLRFIGKKQRTFRLNPSYLGTLYEISKLALKLNFDEVLIQKDPFYESRALIEKHIKSMSLIVAIAVLNSQLKIRLFKRVLAWYFMWRLTPETLFALSLQVIELNNLQDFMSTIRSVRGWRITQPKANLSPAENGG